MICVDRQDSIPDDRVDGSGQCSGEIVGALTSERPYREASTREAALEHIREQSRKHFDPDVVKVFLKPDLS